MRRGSARVRRVGSRQGRPDLLRVRYRSRGTSEGIATT